MKKQILITLASLGFLIGFAVAESNAQTWYAYTDVQYVPSGRYVDGFTTTYLDFYAGLYYDPAVDGDLYRTDMNETSLDHGYHRGYADIIDAEVYLFTTNYVEGKTYCSYGTHFIIDIYDERRYVVSRLNPCVTIAFPPTPTPPPPTPTPTPCEPLNGLPCQSPTPTPTPAPGPTPTVKISEVGFTGDRPIRQLAVTGNPYIDEPDGTTSTWRSNDNPKYPVAYRKGTSPTLFAKFTITPTLTSTRSVLMQIKKGSSIVASNISVDLIGNQVRKNGISIPFSNLEPGSLQFVKKSEYEFTWQISFDNGQNWIDLDKKSKHDVHWLNSNPPDETNFKPFVNSRGTTYQGLFDKALEWSTGKVENNEPDLKKVIQKINSKVAGKVTYDPGIISINDNPLLILAGQQNGAAVCRDNALILAGLLRSIGIDSLQEKYHWGGEESTDRRNYYCPPEGCGTISTQKPLGNRLTMQTKRDQLGCTGFPECVPRNPSFVYHATIIHDGRSFDPSYGIVEGNLELLTAVKVIQGQQPQCVYNAAATNLLVSRDSFGNPSLDANNNTNRICSPILSSLVSDVRSFKFDANGGSDIAVINVDDSSWGIREEFGDQIQIPGFAPGPTVSAVLAADYDGDGLIDPAGWFTNDGFFYMASANYYKQHPIPFRQLESGEKALTGDYDGDGLSDIAVWRGSDGRFTYLRSSDQETVVLYWGGSSFGDIPVPGDYDGDGKTDIAVFRTSNGQWWIRRSSDMSTWTASLGSVGDIPVQGDYDGDGKTDFAIARPSDGSWWFMESESNYISRVYSGPIFSSNDWPVPADYNSDSKIDVAVWFKDTGTWFILDSQTMGPRLERYGRLQDIPVQSLSVVRP